VSANGLIRCAAGASVITLPVGLAVLVSALSGSSAACIGGSVASSSPSAGAWTATAYGPPWSDGNGGGITATGLNLTAGPPAFEVAVDPSVIALRSYVHVEPNPFGTQDAFYAGDTGGAITGQHVDIYDWQGRQAQDTWGARPVTVTPAPAPGAGNLLGAVPAAPPTPAGGAAAACSYGTVALTAAQTAQIQPDGTALAPADAPQAVKLAIAAGNRIHTLPYPDPDAHYGPLSQLWPAYDCSGSASFVLYTAGLLSSSAEDSGDFETYGLPGPGHWLTVYANSAHMWIVVAGIAFDTADYGGTPIPAGSGPRWRADPLANLQDGTQYVARHPPGL
jgi:3D (Asp-Asp-Asp) domain-containing protein